MRTGPQHTHIKSWRRGRRRLLSGLVGSRALCDTLLEREQLLRTECLIVDLGGRLNQVLQVCSVSRNVSMVRLTRRTSHKPCEEVTQVHELAVVSVLHVDDSPTVLASTDRLAVNNHVILRTDDGKGDDLLQR